MELKLYEINDALRELIESGWVIDQETGEILFEGPAGLQELELAREEKIISVAAVIKETKSSRQAFAEERKKIEKKLAARESQYARKEEWLLGYLEQNLNPGEKIKTTLTSIAWKSTKSVAVDPGLDLTTLPHDLVRIKIEPEKAAIKAALEGGQQIPGLSIAERLSIAIR